MTESIIDGVDYGPLAGLAGEWFGDAGMDVAPEPDGSEENPFHETIIFEPCGTVTNAESQTLAVMRYHQVVRRKSNDEVFHNESGYWMWDGERNLVMQTLTIPRAVALVAGGGLNEDGLAIRVRAALDDPDWPIAQAPFMRDQASTVAFEHQVQVDGDVLVYEEHTAVDIYGKRFDHVDSNTLERRRP